MPPPDSERRPVPALSPSKWFAEEVQPHESTLRSWLRGLFPSLPDVDDVVQESYVRLIRAREAGKVNQAKAYLLATARNAALDFFRRRKIVSIEAVGHLQDSTVLDDRPGVADALSRQQELDRERRCDRHRQQNEAEAHEPEREEAGRDLDSKDMELLTRARQRMVDIGQQLDPLKETARISMESRMRTAEIAKQVGAYRNPDSLQAVEYRSAGEYVAILFYTPATNY